ncbi:glutathione peroxidase [Alcanivorax sp. S6407]|uniref:glutathione peroxidase n=1 Tax=Alcanivorax sp. S6407 TaxID=2926424 RepID=UPI001FF1B85B|nr:glutathione peroxidase [Alcanivorax sp. S6407]
MIRILKALLLALPLATITVPAQASDCPALFDTQVRKLHSKDSLDLCALTRGHTTLVVNTASRCGYTGQFKGLESLYQRYKDQGLVIIGFPSDDFRQELNDEAETAKVCYINYGVTFPMAATSKVKGADANPVFRTLTEATEAPGWNFNKYLVSADGQAVQHFPASEKPLGGALEDAIKAALQTPTSGQ